MGLGKIIALIGAAITFIVIVFQMSLQFWVEGIVIDALVDAFGISPFIAILITLVGIVVFILAIIKVAGSVF